MCKEGYKKKIIIVKFILIDKKKRKQLNKLKIFTKERKIAEKKFKFDLKNIFKKIEQKKNILKSQYKRKE